MADGEEEGEEEEEGLRERLGDAARKPQKPAGRTMTLRTNV
jgi:hypothetical protein